MTETPKARANALQIFHVNVNCSDFDRSLAFYKTIGFREYLDFAVVDDGRTFGISVWVHCSACPTRSTAAPLS